MNCADCGGPRGRLFEHNCTMRVCKRCLIRHQTRGCHVPVPAPMPLWLDLQFPDAGVDLPATVRNLERSLIETALSLTDGNQAQAAALLKLNRTTLVAMMGRCLKQEVA